MQEDVRLVLQTAIQSTPNLIFLIIMWGEWIVVLKRICNGSLAKTGRWMRRLDTDRTTEDFQARKIALKVVNAGYDVISRIANDGGSVEYSGKQRWVLLLFSHDQIVDSVAQLMKFANKRPTEALFWAQNIFDQKYTVRGFYFANDHQISQWSYSVWVHVVEFCSLSK